jgi:hypothetical protein
MALLDIFNAVHAQLAIGYPALTSEFGAEHLDEQGSPPRMIWIPTRDEYSGAMQGNSGRSPRALFTVFEGVTIHFWLTPEYGDAKAFVQDFVRALFALGIFGAQAVKLGTGTWIANNADLMRLGRVYELDLQFAVPIVEVSPVTAAVTSTPQTNQIVFPGQAPQAV